MSERETRITPNNRDDALADADGYQIVVAGPGTGKTEFLVQRVLHLVGNGVAKRDEIVVLSFSRRASATLGKRIEDEIGETGVPVDVTTFHSLALRLLEASSGGQRLNPLTTPEQVDLVGRILQREESRDWPLTYQGILTTSAFAAEVADFLMRCSERLLTPDDLDERAKERADWRGLPGLYRTYLEALERSGRTDYGVLLTTAVRLLGTPAGETAHGFRYVLVDEYQDTSPVQARMANLLAIKHGNLTVTGDPYQSIYSFRGAELRNIADFTDQHENAKRLVLSKSFRVPSQILQSALRVVSGGALPGAAGPVEAAPHQGRTETFVFDQETAEAEWIAREVERALRVDHVRPSDIAVLVRTKRELLSELSRALERRGVPHDPPQSRLVDHPAIRLFHDVVTVSVLENSAETVPSQINEADRAMRRILLGPVLGLGIGHERSLFRQRTATRSHWSDVLRAKLPLAGGLADLIDDDRWTRDGPAIDSFWHAWISLGLVTDLVNDPARAEWRRAWSAFAQVLSRQAERDPSLTLSRFFELAEEEDFEATPLLSHRLSEDRVTLTTLHQAKGLEFDLVFIANAVEGVFPDLRRSRRMLRPELLSPERTTDPHAQHLFQLQEEMRLAYTAMTRARLRVVWTATNAGVDQGELRPSRFLIAASGKSGLSEIGPPVERAGDPVTISEAETVMRRTVMDPAAADATRLAFATVLVKSGGSWWDAMSFPGVPERGPDTPILGETIHLSPSQADGYQRCPRRYALERRLRLGDSGSVYAHFGSLIHSALEKSESGVVGSGSIHASPDVALEALESVWADADFGTPELNDAWLAKGRDAIVKLYDQWPSGSGPPVDLERRVEAVVGGVEWVGVIDRVEKTDIGLRVVDYKTSTTATSVDDAAKSIQLGFYASALGEQSDEDVVDAQLWFPRTNTKSVATRSFDFDRLDEVRDEMVRVTEEIRSECWDPSIGDHCARCPFRLSCPAWPEGRGAFLP